jgi:hypothetical protein
MDSDALIGQAFFTILIPSKQVAAHLRGELLQGYWNGTMAGVPALAAELNMNLKRTVSVRSPQRFLLISAIKSQRCRAAPRPKII